MKARHLFALAVAIVLFAGCEERPTDNNSEDPKAYLLGISNESGSTMHEIHFYNFQEEGEVKLSATYGGLKGSTAKLTLAADNQALASYNTANGTRLAILPDNCFSIPEGQQTVTADNRKASFTVRFDYAALKKLSQSADLGDYLLPLSLGSDKMEINPAMKTVYYYFSMQEALLSVENSGKLRDVNIFGQEDEISLDCKLVTDFENPFDDCTFELDYSSIVLKECAEQHKEELGEHYAILPESAFTYDSNGRLPIGQSEVTAKFRLDPKAMPKGVYYLAVRLKSSTIDIDPEKNYILYRIINAGYVDRSNWTAPYANAFQKSRRPTNLFSSATLEGDNNLFESPWSTNRWYDQYFQGWSLNDGKHCIPMVAIIDAGKEINIGAFRLTRRGNNEAYKLRGGEIWISNDTSNDSKLPAAPTQEDFDNTSKCPYDYNEGLYKEWFENKKWEKALTFDYGNSNTLTNIHYSGNLKARYIQVKLTTPGEGITEVHLDEIHILGY